MASTAVSSARAGSSHPPSACTTISRKTKQRTSAETAEQRQNVAPDSTTDTKLSSDFALGEDVLLKHKDGCYYLGVVVSIDDVRKQYLVKFLDNTQSWSGARNLKRPETKQEDLSLCVICKKSSPKNSHEIVVCDICSRGYHQHCHDPKIPLDCQKDGNVWMCKRCWDADATRQKTISLKVPKLRASRGDSSNAVSCLTSGSLSFPYDIDLLTWDEYHRVNIEKIYCYCGGNGEWYTQMLQCSRCKQWFHEKCVKCLRYPLYCGDRFYVFVCANCNEGAEFLRRLELNWVELVHLMLFNLTAYNVIKYYDLDRVIIPYINDNWHALQLPPKIYNVSIYDRRKNILSVLTNNRNRFKCGREIKKRTAIWGLRVRLPPPAPCIHVPPAGPISEDQLKQMYQNSRKIRFLPEEKTDNGGPIVPVDNHMVNLMMGTAYLEHVQSGSESSSASRDELANRVNNCNYNGPVAKPSGNESCAKKSVIYSTVDMRRKKRPINLKNKHDKTKNQKADRETPRRSVKKLSVDTGSTKTGDILPLTPPISLSAPPTPPASSSTSTSGTDLAADYCCDNSNSFINNLMDISKTDGKLTQSNLTKNSLDSNLVELNTPCDTSGDETSSKSTLDLIIPPPKDFKGQNNPFLTLLKGGNSNQKRRSKDITLPLPLTAVIPGAPLLRPTKRQLSEKDICIGPNGEVKRRRLRRNRAIPPVQTASKTAAVVPIRPDATEWGQRSNNIPSTSAGPLIGNCVDYALNGRRLRQRTSGGATREKEKISSPPTPKQSPVKQDPDIDMDDLKSSVNMYFGVANRIAAGEKFIVRAKRVGPNGKLQYLMEWQGSSNAMT